jgi:hypothetical protein
MVDLDALENPIKLSLYSEITISIIRFKGDAFRGLKNF